MRERDVVSGMAVFVAIVESGSLTAAARRLGLTTSAVSKLVARLEDGFGTTLLRRTTRSMTVTEAGQTYFDRARTVLEELRAVEQEMASKSAEPRGLVRVSAPQLLGQTRVMPIVLAFSKKMPTVSLDVELTDRVVDMVGERIDVAVRIALEPPPSFVARRVGTIRRVLCASPSYLRSRRAPKTPQDLDDHDCLLLSGPAATDTWQFVPAVPGGPPVSRRVTPRLRVSNTLSLHEAARAGLGIADLPQYLVEEDLRARRLVPVLAPFETLERGVFVVYAAGPLLPARVRLIASHLVQELEKALSFS